MCLSEGATMARGPSQARDYNEVQQDPIGLGYQWPMLRERLRACVGEIQVRTSMCGFSSSLCDAHALNSPCRDYFDLTPLNLAAAYFRVHRGLVRQTATAEID